MSDFYVINEDHQAPCQIYLGFTTLSAKERQGLVLGDTSWLDKQPLKLPVAYWPAGCKTDFMNVKFPLVSVKLRELLEANVRYPLFCHTVYLDYQGDLEPYFYLLPPQIDCFDYRLSQFDRDEDFPGGIRLKVGGFKLHAERVVNRDIFRVKGLSNRLIVVSERLKKQWEQNSILGAKFTVIREYQD